MTYADLAQEHHGRLVNWLASKYKIQRTDAEEVAQLTWVHLLTYDQVTPDAALLFFTAKRIYVLWVTRRQAEQARREEWGHSGWRIGVKPSRRVRCKVPGCKSKVYVRGLCATHGGRRRRRGQPRP